MFLISPTTYHRLLNRKEVNGEKIAKDWFQKKRELDIASIRNRRKPQQNVNLLQSRRGKDRDYSVVNANSDPGLPTFKADYDYNDDDQEFYSAAQFDENFDASEKNSTEATSMSYLPQDWVLPHFPTSTPIKTPGTNKFSKPLEKSSLFYSAAQAEENSDVDLSEKTYNPKEWALVPISASTSTPPNRSGVVRFTNPLAKSFYDDANESSTNLPHSSKNWAFVNKKNNNDNQKVIAYSLPTSSSKTPQKNQLMKLMKLGPTPMPHDLRDQFTTVPRPLGDQFPQFTTDTTFTTTKVDSKINRKKTRPKISWEKIFPGKVRTPRMIKELKGSSSIYRDKRVPWSELTPKKLSPRRTRSGKQLDPIKKA